ncbi:hypothetical protein Scep_018289 [Stephania cephalantha]|uniref:Uncharacterized protein n=1 Tax=Stephania cephalantha TaxID=152367 RepID=A0AAP0ITB2_9MAGN
MGSAQSTQIEEEEDEEDEGDGENERRELSENPLMKRVLEQEPEMLPCHASASPLSPQLSNVGTPRLGPSIKVWDPYNVLAPPPQLPPRPAFSRSFSADAAAVADYEKVATEVFLINHGECSVSLRPDLVGGRWPEADLTPNGKRQARALAVFLNSQGIRFNAVYSSPLNRARATALSVCQFTALSTMALAGTRFVFARTFDVDSFCIQLVGTEMNFSEEQIQTSDELVEMSQGQWEGCLRSEIYTADVLGLIERSQPDFSAPSGESLRQVEFRMIQFINATVLRLPEKIRMGELSMLQNENKGFSRQNSHVLPSPFPDRDVPELLPPSGDLVHRHRQGLPRRKSGKSRLQFVTTTGDHEGEYEISYREASHEHLSDMNDRTSSSSCSSSIGIFTHAMPIRCLVAGILGCSGAMSHKICIDDSSVTVLRHSLRTGWQIKRVNDTAHLRLL